MNVTPMTAARDPRPPPADAPPPARGLDARTRTAIFAVACFGGMFAIGAGVGWGLRAASSVLVGTVIAIANLYGLARILGAVIGSRTHQDPNTGIYGVLAIVKVLGLFGGVWL